MAAAPIGKTRLAKLLKQLDAHALGESQLSATQIRAIELLLRRDGGASSTKESESRVIVFHLEHQIVCPECDQRRRELPDE